MLIKTTKYIVDSAWHYALEFANYTTDDSLQYNEIMEIETISRKPLLIPNSRISY
jgi:hypothetical protein